MNNSIVFNKIHMINRIFNLHLFLSCSFTKSHVQKLFCLVFSSEPSEGSLEPRLRTELHREVWTPMLQLHSLQREERTGIVSWWALEKFKAAALLLATLCICHLWQVRQFWAWQVPATSHTRGPAPMEVRAAPDRDLDILLLDVSHGQTKCSWY